MSDRCVLASPGILCIWQSVSKVIPVMESDGVDASALPRSQRCVEQPQQLSRSRSTLCEEALEVINLVDPASSHMLVSKIKPCMSQYKLPCRDNANDS